MGLWGLQPFSNDAAVDWLIQLEEDEQADLEELRAALRGVREDVQKAYAAAAVVAASRGFFSGELDSAVTDWIEILPELPDNSDIDVALSILDDVERVYVGWSGPDHRYAFERRMKVVLSELRRDLARARNFPVDLVVRPKSGTRKRPPEKLAPGDVIELPLPSGGFAYLQYTATAVRGPVQAIPQEGPYDTEGEAICGTVREIYRGLPGRHETPLGSAEIAELVAQPQVWMVAYKAVMLVRDLNARVVGNFAVPTEASGVPPMLVDYEPLEEVENPDGTTRPYVGEDASRVTQPRHDWLDPEIFIEWLDAGERPW